jgi:2',3'-cyclic-nucleotide 2'-phosphodiesterase
MSSGLSVLVLGDVVGVAGVRALSAGLPVLIDRYDAEFVVVNAENAADGFGITPAIAGAMFESGVSVITTGNHIWQRREILPYLDTEPRVLRPANYPLTPSGAGVYVLDSGEVRVIVLNLQGRVRLSNVDCPFQVADVILGGIVRKGDVILVDFHAEDTEEKEAMGLFLDGRVSAVFGTHTHVQTSDERILGSGTAYITDIGMTGPIDGVIGFDPAIAVRRMSNQMPLKMKVLDTAAAIRGAHIEIERSDGKARSISRIDFRPEV